MDIFDFIHESEETVSDIFPTFEEAAATAHKLGIASPEEYCQRHFEHSRLPRNPELVYQNWMEKGGWTAFLGYPKQHYLTVEDAMAAVRRLNILCDREYRRRHREDPNLPANPARTYGQDFIRIGKYRGYFGQPLADFYPHLWQAKNAAKQLGIENSTDYQSRYQQDERLPSNPEQVYAKEWPGWKTFLDMQPYSTIWEASQAAQRLGIKTYPEYQRRYKEDPRLLYTVDIYYADQWEAIGKWRGFLGRPPFYPTLSEASQAARRLKIKSGPEYKKNRRQDPRLPVDPPVVYGHKQWKQNGGWYGFLGKTAPYRCIHAAMRAIQKLKITSVSDYKNRRHLNPRLPSKPEITFRKDWQKNGRWLGYLGKLPQAGKKAA